MIRYENIKVVNLYTEGFATTIEEGMTLSIGTGTYNHIEGSGVTITNFPEFAFDVVADSEFQVVYDVYLLAEENVDGSTIHIDRTELGGNAIAFYEGEAKLLHCLTSFIVPPNATDLNGLDIKVRTVQSAEEAVLSEVGENIE